MIAFFDNNYQNPSVVCFVMLIRAIALCSPLGLQKFEFEKENEMLFGSCSQLTSS